MSRPTSFALSRSGLLVPSLVQSRAKLQPGWLHASGLAALEAFFSQSSCEITWDPPRVRHLVARWGFKSPVMAFNPRGVTDCSVVRLCPCPLRWYAAVSWGFRLFASPGDGSLTPVAVCCCVTLMGPIHKSLENLEAKPRR